MRLNFRIILLLPALLFCTPAPAAPALKPVPAPPPLALITTPAGQQPIRLTRAVLDGEVHGRLLEATLDLSFVNPNARVLEGELQFPLADGQTLAGFALELADGTLMPAVPVPRARARQAFDDTIRVRADPALLEQVEGNRFRLRVYPLAPGQPRRVRLQLEVALGVDTQFRHLLALPLAFGLTRPEELQVHLRLPEVAASTLRTSGQLAGASVRSEDGRTLVDLAVRVAAGSGPDATGVTADAAGLRWSAPEADAITTGRSGGQAWFQATLQAPHEVAPRKAPRQLTLVWDASGSGATRDHAREFALLDQVFHWRRTMHVVLRVVRDAAEPDRAFDVQGGDWHALRAVLENLPYDGASNAGLWRVGPEPAGVAALGLLFSDGLGNWGAPPRPEPDAMPAFAVMSGAGADAAVLRAWAESRQGRLVDLGRLDDAQAFATVVQRVPELLRVEGQGFELASIASRYPEGGVVQLAARFTDAQASASLVWRLPDGSERQQPLRVDAPPAAADGPVGFAARRWASLRVAALQADAASHQGEIEALCQQFGLTSAQTSLLVLERLDDFLRFGIEPPTGPLRARYLAARRDQQASELRQRHDHLEQLASRFAEYRAWWQHDFPKDAPAIAVRPSAPAASRALIVPRVAAAMNDQTGNAGSERVRQAPAAPAAPVVMARRAPPPLAGEREAADLEAPALGAEPVAAKQALGTGTPVPPAPTIDVKLAAWSPDTASQRRLRDADPARRYAVYLDERLRAPRSPAFFLDAAQVFEAAGAHALALRILSNLVELDAGDRALLRVLAYRLQQLEQGDEALRLLRRVAELAPDEPQSWRDLGLAQAAAGQVQPAIDALWRVASGVWSPRFADIDLIALTELDAIAATHPGTDLSAVDERLRQNLPLDIRVALAWDADNTDVDLWVKDPDGEWTSYQNPVSRQGGHVSRDCTQGYGPEVFSLKTAKAGHYEVRARYYGSRMQTVSGYPTLLLHLTRAFGTTRESSRDVVVRLEEVKDDLLIGSFDVGTSGQEGRP